jgi:hypothetical protein
MEARSRKHGDERVYFYGCSARHRKAARVCTNSLTVPLRMADLAVLEALKSQLLAPSVIEEALSRAASQLAAPRHGEAAQWQTRLSTLEAQVKNLAEAITGGGDIPVLVTTLKAKEAERQEVALRLAALRRAPQALDVSDIREQLRGSTREWQKTLRGHSSEARMLLQQHIDEHLKMKPCADEEGSYYEFSGVGTLVPIVVGAVSHELASPSGLTPLPAITGRVQMAA